jgi:hypothetical protein
MLWRMLSRLETCIVYSCIWSVTLAKSIVPLKTWRKLWHSYISKLFLTKMQVKFSIFDRDAKFVIIQWITCIVPKLANLLMHSQCALSEPISSSRKTRKLTPWFNLSLLIICCLWQLPLCIGYTRLTSLTL